MVDRRTFTELERASHGIAAQNPPTVPSYRPLQGLRPNQMGQSIQFDPPADPTTFTSVIKTLVDSRTPSEEAEICTIMVEAQVVNTPITPLVTIAGPDLLGIIHWGIGGASFSANFDVGKGACFSLLANWVRVDVQYSLPQSAAVIATVLVSAAIGYGNVSLASSGSRLSIRTGLVAPNFSTLVAIPDFANSFSVQNVRDAGGVIGTAQIDIKDIGGNTLASFEQASYNNGGQRENTFPIPASVAAGVAGGLPFFVQLKNDSTVNSFYTVVFNLAL